MRVVSVVSSLFALFVTLIFLPVETSANNSSGQGGHFQSQGHSNSRHGFGCDWWRNCGTWFIAPQNYASGQSIQGVDPATGVLRQSQSDLSPLKSGLGLRRFYQSSSFENSWLHQYDRRLGRGQELSYADYEGLKSDLYRHAKNACHDGWPEMRDTAYNGQYSTAEANYHQGLCEIKDSGSIVVRLPIHRTRHSHNNNLRTVTRPNGTVYTFVKHNQQWKTLSKAPVQLKRARNYWIFTDVDGSTEKYTDHGRLLSMTNAESQTTTLKYDYYGRLKKVEDQFGHQLIFSYHHYWGDQLKKVTSPTGTVNYSYDQWDRLTQTRYQDGSTQTYHYEDDTCESCLTKTINAAGEVEQQISYNQQGLVISSQEANGSNLRNFSYGSGEVVVSDSAEAEIHYEFNLHHGILKIAKLTDAMGQSEVFNYDSNGYPASHIAKNGSITKTEYNNRGLLDVSIENAGTDTERETSFQWHPDFRKPIERSEASQTTAFDYDDSGRLTQQVQRPNNDSTANDEDVLEGRITDFSYNALGQIIETISPNGSNRKQSYDEEGNQTSTTNALGHQTETLAFDSAGRPLKIQDSNGVVTENQYDSAGRRIKSTINGLITRYQYDRAGRQIKVTFPDGTYSENQYDGSGNVIKIINQRGEVTENTYDTNGNRTSIQIVDADGNIVAKTETRYNLLNQAIQTTDASGNHTSFEYDASGNKTKFIDAKGNITQNQYNSENQLIKTIDALGGEAIYEYDINGNNTKVIAANGTATEFTYDSFNQLKSENSPDRGLTLYDYDISGNRIQTVDANNNIKNTQYDDLKRRIQENWEGHPELTANYSYDNCTNGISKLCQVTDASGDTRYQYNNNGQITLKDQNIAGITLRQQFSYFENRKLQSQIYPSGTKISYSYNEDQLSTIAVNNETFIQNIEYDAANRITGWQWADNSIYSKSYDQNGRLKTFTLGEKLRTLVYDGIGNIIAWTDTNSDEYKQFDYDALNRLNAYNKNLAIESPEIDDEIIQSQRFSYDANGNRKNLVEDGINTTNYQIKPGSNRLTAIDSNIREYDANGNLINDGEHTYQYDARNRLASVDGIINNLYNANGQRVKKNSANEAVIYAWTSEHIFGEYTAQGDPIQETIYFDNTPIGVIKANTVYRIYTDQTDTPRVISNNNDNKVVWLWESKPFGESNANEDPDNDDNNFTYNLRFPGQYYDIETGLHYNWNRHYDPQTGRYSTSDPSGLTGGLNLYSYANNNTLLFTDSAGLAAERADSDSIFVFWASRWYGTHVHNKVFTPYVKNERGLSANDTNGGIFGSFRPDAYSLTEIWELKPISYLSPGSKRREAEAQINSYVAKGNESNSGALVYSKGNPFRIFPTPWVTSTIYEGDEYALEFFADTEPQLNGYSGLVFYMSQKLGCGCF
ncbi:MAG: hypothetical protein GQ475_02915 [Methylococcaceae bacterium]|nr:hypothetical protein [Methylococcaceae bacterium]